MLDRLRVARDELRGIDDEAGYLPEQAILGSSLHVAEGSDRLTVVFPPWHANERLNKWLEKRAIGENSSILSFNVNHLILNSDPYSVSESFGIAADTMAARIAEVDTVHNFQRKEFTGFSMGNVLLSMVASRVQSFDKVTMIVPGTELAEPFWTGRRTRLLSDSYRERGYTLTQIQEMWKELAPISHLGALANKEIRIILSDNDIYIPSQSGQELVTAMQNHRLQPTVFRSRLGHVATIVAYAKGYIK